MDEIRVTMMWHVHNKVNMKEETNNQVHNSRCVQVHACASLVG